MNERDICDVQGAEILYSPRQPHRSKCALDHSEPNYKLLMG